ncbi:hypothetical protein BDQ17DRAFT_1413169 [Cyathus striatus]|nr:hypothetical protein BDQ17DRAFT_1413169 [Cyathus striatus]
MSLSLLTECVVAPTIHCQHCGRISGKMFPSYEPDQEHPYESLRNSYSPSPFEEKQISARIRERRQEMVHLDMEISRLKATVTGMELRRSTIENYVDRQQSLLAPVRKLPVEILCHIFSLSSSSSPIDVFSPNTFVRIVSQVCSYWRDVACSTPSLWSTISVQNIPASIGENPRMLRLVASYIETCVRRSSKSPLTLSFARDCHPRLLGAAQETIAHQATRWESISIPALLLSSILSRSLCGHRFSKLQCLEIDGTDYTGTGEIDLTDAPYLSSLTLCNVRRPTERLHLPWSQITFFESHSNRYGLGELGKLLGLMSNLQSFHFTGDHYEDPDNKYVQLPNLTKMVVNSHPLHAASLLQLLATPALTDLTLNATSALYQGHIEHFVVAFLQRSECELRSLSLRNISLNTLRGVDAMSSLADLDLNETPSVMQDLKVMTRDKNIAAFMPRLQALRFSYSGYLHTDTLIEVIRSRLVSQEEETPSDQFRLLQSASLQISQDLETKSLESLDLLVKETEGSLELVIKHIS